MRFAYKKKSRAFYLIATSDIAFLLLIFLVVTSSLEYDKDIDPPESPYVEELKGVENSLIIEVSKEGVYSILNFAFTLPELPQMIGGTNEYTIIKIYADKDVDFSLVNDLLEELKREQRHQVFLLIKKEVLDASQ